MMCQDVLFAYTTLQGAGDGDQRSIAAVVSVGVVDLLEAIEIEGNGADRLVGLPAGGQSA
jgi:hypothetical protein